MMIYLRFSVGDFIVQGPEGTPNLDLFWEWRYGYIQRVDMIPVECWNGTATCEVSQVKSF
jgi:hypothetical protein